ncbi:hypothetical protein A1Q1_05279 [Trichosporon asahii var. asahii CBS 2479]|uniref:Uncharacterized protein n=1 Tax=Trichosporon asahii var. asahii (strain ATCC 90039 / CBS 2479 / JCM 2466 / KCTC 7840 / NBRC 103889/ NCYC 2677 / UAMH 7654) TaxID=1186058 RepID=J4U7C7_TRIAS|nr:hypothetical protein A1Q1_05279 [Trichosporon asahii var. asahii CBS 2479]EJT46195.1 hypothetical protein A1Q1_05279 [Trichosporon asahii var. asahii CBS 2479]
MRLPTLLASLPKDGKHALVRPQIWPENSFYRVTKTNLKFREVQGPEPNETYLRAKGKAWGQLFWKGKQVHPRDRHSPPIKNALKHKWEIVPPTSVASMSSAFAAADQAQAQAEAAARAELVKKREAKRVRVAEAAEAKRQLQAIKDEKIAKHQAWMDELYRIAKAKRLAKQKELKEQETGEAQSSQ